MFFLHFATFALAFGLAADLDLTRGAAFAVFGAGLAALVAFALTLGVLFSAVLAVLLVLEPVEAFEAAVVVLRGVATLVLVPRFVRD